MQGAWIETFSAPAPRRAKAALVLLSLSSSIYSPLFSSLLLMDRKLYARRPHMAHKKERTQASLHIISPSPLSLSFTDRTRQRAFGAQIG